MATTKRDAFRTRRMRMRSRLKKLGGGRPRLSVHRSNRNIQAQLIDDSRGVTLAAASTMEKGLELAGTVTTDSAARIGALVAERARDAGIEACYFDRGGFRYHGRVKALADAAREGGLKF